MMISQKLLVAALALLTVTPVLAEDSAQEDNTQTIESSISKDGKSTPCLGACTVNFRKELGVPFDYLMSIGSVIHQARETPDPVALASAAKSLAAAEAVAEKKAQVTSDQVLAEAIELVTLRGDAKELKAVAMLVDDPATKKDLSERAKAAADQSAGEEEGESSREFFGDLVVDNDTHETVKIYFDGRYMGRVNPHGHAHFHVHSHRHHHHMDAICVQGGEVVAHRDLQGHYHGYHWHIRH